MHNISEAQSYFWAQNFRSMLSKMLRAIDLYILSFIMKTFCKSIKKAQHKPDGAGYLQGGARRMIAKNQSQ